MVIVRADMRARLAAVAGAAAMLLAACSHDPYVNVTDANTKTSDGWRIEQQLDRVTGAPISSAMLMSSRVSNSAILVPPPARLQLACFKEHAAVVIAFAFKIGSTRNTEFGYRFGDKPGREASVRVVDDYRSVLIEDPNEVVRFSEDMATSNDLYLRIRSLTASGRTSAEFKVSGAPAAIAVAYAGCPLTPDAHASASPPAMRSDKKN